MKPSSYVLNLGCGPIINEVALNAALQAGRIAGAGLVVTEQEPIQPDNPLLRMEDVIITPHALCWTDACFRDIAETRCSRSSLVSLGVG
jgi:phosphoglycerate dehydrogenase-like enzyme